MSLKKVIIVGGGLAGLTSSLHLLHYGLSVTLIEKNSIPRHKVCGEYLSNEVLPYLQSLGFDPFIFKAKSIKHFELSSVKGKSIQVPLPLGGFSISRFTLDKALLDKALLQGLEFIEDSVRDIEFIDNHFEVGVKSNRILKGDFVIGAFGKRSNLDQKLNRKFLKLKAPYLAVKAHYKGEYPEDVVGLYHFYGGYCGVSKVENDQINICYIVQYKDFKKYNNIEDFQQQVICQNKALAKIYKSSSISFKKPLSISQISFESKPVVEDHILMCGDSAGMIHPLCGNGMSMAIQGAKMASELIVAYFENGLSRADVEKNYERKWKKAFRTRVETGRWLAKLFKMKTMALYIMNSMRNYPGIVRSIISRTHGKTLEKI